jgi:Rieske Fe-S protein
MVDSSTRKRSPYTSDRGLPGAFDGETVTRRRLFEGGALALGGVAGAAIGLPALGFALGPIFEDQTPQRLMDVGPVEDFNPDSYVPKVMSVAAGIGEAGKTTIYVRKYNRRIDAAMGPPDTPKVTPYIAISTRCAHLGCPVRFVQASQRFICPCHGGVYDSLGQVIGGPPPRPLDRFYTKVENGRVLVGDRFSLDSQLRRYPNVRDPSQHLDGFWKYLYPGRPTT